MHQWVGPKTEAKPRLSQDINKENTITNKEKDGLLKNGVGGCLGVSVS